jgi:hypothetical protein
LSGAQQHLAETDSFVEQHSDEEDFSVEQSHPQDVFFVASDLSVEQQHGLEGCFIAFSNYVNKKGFLPLISSRQTDSGGGSSGLL